MVDVDMQSEVSQEVDFSGIRYAQCWEDADILLQALDIQPDHVCLSIASAGDNTLALLSKGPARVVAIDLSPAQLTCLELRVAAYRALSHAEMLELIGSAPSNRRESLYRRCRNQLSPDVRHFWDGRSRMMSRGLASTGKFERYLDLFRRFVLPLVHSRARVERLFKGGTLQQRQDFFHTQWDTWRWRLLFLIFFSRFMMGRLGRDPCFFRYVRGCVAERISDRAHDALTTLNPAQNPYLQWILTGRHTTALPYALRPENFEPIRRNLERLEWRCQSLETFLGNTGNDAIDRFNLSDIFEYMSLESYHRLLQRVVDAGRSGGRLAYWNMLVPRSRPQGMAAQLRPRHDLAQRLYQEDKAFFYSAFVVEEIA